MPVILPYRKGRDIPADLSDFAKWIANGLVATAKYLGRPLNQGEAEEERKRLATLYWRNRKQPPTPHGDKE